MDLPSVWSDVIIIFPLFGHLVQWKYAQWPHKIPKVGLKIVQTLNNPSKNTKYFKQLARVSKFLQVWSHCLPVVRFPSGDDNNRSLMTHRHSELLELLHKATKLIEFQKRYLRWKRWTTGWGAQLVGSAIASDTRDLWFESSHYPNFIYYQLY